MLWSTRPALIVSAILASGFAVLAAVSGCGNSANVTVAGPSTTRCGVSIAGSSSPAPAAGGTGTVIVSIARECAWSARSESSWIALSSTEGQGPASLGYSILPNPNGTLRRGTVAVEDQRVEISQEPAPCGYDVSPSSVDLGANGDTSELNLVTPGGCGWTTRPSDTWLTLEPSSGAGATTVRLVVAPNPGSARTGNVSISGATVAVRQAGVSTTPPAPVPPMPPTPPTPAPPTPAPPTPPPSPPSCAYSLVPVSRTVSASAEDVTVEVRAVSGCAWAASSGAGWITVRSGDRGTGNGSVKLAVSNNTSPSARTGTVVIAGATFTIEQAGAQACGYTIRPTYYNAGRGPDDAKIDVRSTGECRWSATSNASWVSVSEGATGTGNGSVRLLVQANSGGPRRTTLTIAGEPFTLSQEGACQATLKPTDYKTKAGPDDFKVQVKVDDGCFWTSSSPVPWAPITEGAAQSGNGNVRIRIEANPGAERTATLIIAGERFTLTQEASKK
jgi:all-beta uncharacterized protein/BACON domain-containing protein